MTNEVNITINGIEIKADSTQMVIQAASDSGIYIPYLCYHPGMKPYGACRMCVVEVEGAPGTPASCTLPVRDGMVVKTITEPTAHIRSTILDLLMSEHPHGCLTCHRVDLCGPQDICLRHVEITDRCVTCPKNERCELKDTTRFHYSRPGMSLHSPLNYQYRNLQIETKDPFYDRDYNLCIVCARCVRACDELRGDVALTMTERAGQVLVGTSMGTSLLESGCEFCGSCIDVCPVGALVEKDHKWKRAARVERSVCANCPVGCQINYEVDYKERVIRGIPELNSRVNQGQGCYMGKFGFDYVNNNQRLQTPLVRRDGILQPATWDEAMSVVATRLPNYKGDRFAVVATPRATNEELYLAQKFARLGMHTNNVDMPSNRNSSLRQGLAEVLGYGAATGSLWDLKKAECVLVVGANITEEQNVAALPIKQAVRAGTQQLIVIDPREVELTRYAQLWIRPYPQTETVLLGGIARVILEEKLFDQEFLEERCDGVVGLESSLAQFTLQAVSKETGVPKEQIEQAARLFAQHRPASILVATNDFTPAEVQSEMAHAITNLALITGNVGKEGAGVTPLYSGANTQGGWDVGCVPDLLPGSQLSQNNDALTRINDLWGGSLPDQPGLGMEDMFRAAVDGRIGSMLLIGDHASYSDGTLGDVATALQGLEFLVVTDQFLSPVAQVADVVLPSSTALEKSGTYTNFERRVQPLKQVFRSKFADSREDFDIICELAKRMGISGFGYQTPADVLIEIARVVPTYGGITYSRLIDEAVETLRPSPDNPLPTQVQYSDFVSMGIQWPCPSANHPGTPLLYAGSFPMGKANLTPLVWKKYVRKRDSQFPLMLAHGRVLAQPDRVMEIVRSEGLNHIKRLEFFVMTTEDAHDVGVREGQTVNGTTSSGQTFSGIVRLSSEALPGIVSFTTLFGDLALQLDASDHPDPMSRVPRLEVVSLRLEPSK